MDGKVIPQKFEDLVVDGEPYGAGVFIPEWWWMVLMLYINDTEAAVNKVMGLSN